MKVCFANGDQERETIQYYSAYYQTFVGTSFTFHTSHDKTGMIITFRTTRAAGCVSVTELSPSIRLHLPIGFITTWPFPYIRQQKTEYVKKWF